MEFRWVAIIALWTMLSGPVFVRLAMPPAPETSTASLPTRTHSVSAEVVHQAPNYAYHGQ
jgi:hypothetical protein